MAIHRTSNPAVTEPTRQKVRGKKEGQELGGRKAEDSREKGKEFCNISELGHNVFKKCLTLENVPKVCS